MSSGALRRGGASRGRIQLPAVQGVEDEPGALSESEELRRRPEVRIINKYAVVVAYIRIGLKGIGALALLWATVVLLGGFVSTLTNTDFWSLTIVAFVQAAGLSDAMGDDRFAFFGEWLDSLKTSFRSRGEKRDREHTQPLQMPQRLKREINKIVSRTVDIILMFIFFPVAFFVLCGPVICFAICLVRVIKPDYGIADGDTGKVNLKPALNLFYYISLSHGAAYYLLMAVEIPADRYFLEIVSGYGFSPEILEEYLHQTKEMCVNNPASTSSWDLVTYGVGLLDSQSPEDYASGGRVLTMLIDQDILVPITQLLIRSPWQRIQKLIGTLGWRNPADREMRWLSARIMEHIAAHLNLAQFPGALECVSSLLDSSSHNNCDEEALHLPFEIGRSKVRKRKHVIEQIQPRNAWTKREGDMDSVIGLVWRWISKKYGTPNNGGTQGQDSNQRENGEGTDEDLVLPGLTILDNLAHNGHNCTVIYSNKGLLSKLLAPFSSNTLIEDIKTNAAWAKVVDGSLKVVSRLMSSPENIGEKMCSQIATDANAVKNLQEILDMDTKSNSGMIELQIRAMEVLAQLVLHYPAISATGTNELLIERALHFFLTKHWIEDYLKEQSDYLKGEKKIDKEKTSQHNKPQILMERCMYDIVKRTCGEHAKEKMQAQAAKARVKQKIKKAKEAASRIKEKAGEALAMLSMGSHCNSESTMTKNVIDSLTELLDSNIKTIQCGTTAPGIVQIEITMSCRISAAIILKNSSNYLREPTLGKVLAELLPIHASKTRVVDPPGSPRWWESVSYCTAANKNDEENPSDGGQHEPPAPKSHRQQSEERMLQAELLSLVTAICANKDLNFATILLKSQMVAPEDFVVSLKKMVNGDRYATPACLAILKLTCQILIKLIPHDGIIEVIKKHDIIGTLLKASKRMARVESNMLFAGIERGSYGVPLKPLSSVLVKQVQDLLTEKK